jgi:amidase
MVTPPGRPSARAWLARLDAGECSARELTEQTLAAIADADARVHAVVDLNAEAALAEADAADAARRAGQAPQRPLLGLPLTVKDVLDVRGRRTSAGSLARTGHRAQGDATVVARLRAAGAIVVAKTNVPECSCSFEIDNVLFGRTDHPLDPARTPGGSSGGEAALLGSDASIAGIGTDGGGSIRVPAHYTGIVGLRPTTGRTPETGLWPPTRATGTADFTCVGWTSPTAGTTRRL